jgi:hypothetical protein
MGHAVGTARTRAAKWVEEGLRAPADGGPDAARIEAPAKRFSVTTGGFEPAALPIDAAVQAKLP